MLGGGGEGGCAVLVRISIQFGDESIWHSAWPAPLLSVGGWCRGLDEQSEGVCLPCGQSGQRLRLPAPPLHLRLHHIFKFFLRESVF